MNDNGFVKTMSLPDSHNTPDELPFSEPLLSPVTDRPATLSDWTDEDEAIWKYFYDLEPWPETLDGLFDDDELDQEDWVDSDDCEWVEAEDDILSQYGLMVDGRLLDFCEARDICDAVDLMFTEQLQSYDGPGEPYVVNLTELLRE